MQTEAWKGTINEQEAMACCCSLLERTSSHNFIEHHGFLEETKGRQHIEDIVTADIALMETSDILFPSPIAGSHSHMMEQSNVRFRQLPSLTHLIFGSRLFIGLVILFSAGTIYFASSVEAAGIDLGVTAQKAWDSVLIKADAQTKLTLKQAYEKVGNWKTQEQAWEQK